MTMDGNENTVLLTVIEHEFRDVLNGCAGVRQHLSSLIKKSEQTQQPLSVPELKKNLGTLERVQNHFGRILDMLKDYRVSCGETVPLESQAIDFPKVLDQIMHLFNARAREKNIAFTVDYYEEASPIVYGNLMQVTQILYYLLDNAFKFTASGSITIIVSSSWAVSAQNHTIEVSVIDTGSGIKQDKLQTVFNEFLKLNSGSGLGLGLTLVKHFIETMGGKISINSLEGKGTRVTFTLPVTNPTDEGVLKALKTVKIWNIESEESLVPVLVKQLQLSELVTQTIPIKEAIFKCQQTISTELPDIIIVTGQKFTQNMGYFARTVTANPAFKNIFLVLLIAPEQYEYDHEQASANGYHVVLSASKQVLFAESLVNSWTYWKRKGEQMIQIQERRMGANNNRVLVIEDNASNQQIFELFMIDLGIRGDIKGNATTGLAALEEKNYDALVLDMGLPDIRGYDVIKIIRDRKDRIKDIPIIVITAGGHTQTVQQIMDRGADAYLLKPMIMEDMRGVLEPYVKMKE